MNLFISSLRVIKSRNKKYHFFIFVVLLLLFVNSFLGGRILYKTDKEKAEQFVMQFRDMGKIKAIHDILAQGNYALTGTLIFLNNFLIDVFSLYSGIFFVFPILIPVSNVMLLGFMLGIQSSIPDSFSLLRMVLLVVVAAMEFFAMIIVTYEGLRIGLSWINPKIAGKKKRSEALKLSIAEGSKTLVIVAIMLVIAAIIETFGVALLENIV